MGGLLIIAVSTPSASRGRNQRVFIAHMNLPGAVVAHRLALLKFEFTTIVQRVIAADEQTLSAQLPWPVASKGAHRLHVLT